RRTQAPLLRHPHPAQPLAQAVPPTPPLPPHHPFPLRLHRPPRLHGRLPRLRHLPPHGLVRVHVHRQVPRTEVQAASGSLDPEGRTMTDREIPEFGWQSAAPEHTHRFVVPLLRELGGDRIRSGARVLDVGCGNGYNARQYLSWGCSVVGIDASDVGIALARKAYPSGRFVQMLVEDDVLSRLGEAPFDLVNSTEVVEHLYDPVTWARCCFNALRPGGRLLVSTPYHGFLKNLAISLTDGWDNHWEVH